MASAVLPLVCPATVCRQLEIKQLRGEANKSMRPSVGTKGFQKDALPRRQAIFQTGQQPVQWHGSYCAAKYGPSEMRSPRWYCHGCCVRAEPL